MNYLGLEFWLVAAVDITKRQAYRAVNFVLKRKEFRQVEIVRETGVSKGMASVTVNWLLEKGLVEKANEKYRLVSASALFSLFPYFRNMQDNLVASLSVKADEGRLGKELAERKAVFCGTSALQHYSKYFASPEISIYSSDKKILEELKSTPSGLTKVNVFKPDMCLEIDTEKKGKLLLTGKARTIIDLFCDKKAFAAKELIEREYGERIG